MKTGLYNIYKIFLLILLVSCSTGQYIERFDMSGLEPESAGRFIETALTFDPAISLSSTTEFSGFILYTDTLKQRDVIRNSVARVESHPVINDLGTLIPVLPDDYSFRGYEVLYLLQFTNVSADGEQALSDRFMYFSSRHSASGEVMGFGPAYFGILVSPADHVTSDPPAFQTIKFTSQYIIRCKNLDCELTGGTSIATKNQVEFLFKDNGVRRHQDISFARSFDFEVIIASDKGVAGGSYVYIQTDEVLPSGKIVFVPHQQWLEIKSN